MSHKVSVDRRPVVTAGVLLGVGMGGFVDGILFHQLLQSHNMLSAKYPPTNVVNLEVNMFWDGVFHSFTWLTTATGLMALWRAVKLRETVLSDRIFAGSLALGWGLFNLVEGILNHHVLEVHHVREIEEHLVWDVGFLIVSAVLALGGWALIRAAGDERHVVAGPGDHG
jgi:uncharacterized membrane protein